jgi:hypothetical protein
MDACYGKLDTLETFRSLIAHTILQTTHVALQQDSVDELKDGRINTYGVEKLRLCVAWSIDQSQTHYLQ